MTDMACPPEKLKWGDQVRLKTDEKSKGLIVDAFKSADTGEFEYFTVEWSTGQKCADYRFDNLALIKPSFDRS